jgi:glycosyltransferase involved in cell wall biosynthesis
MMAVKGTVLLVSYAFPPMASPGALRAAKFAKYLAAEGWQVDVLTTARSAYSRMVGLAEDAAGTTARVWRTRDLEWIKARLLARPAIGNSGSPGRSEARPDGRLRNSLLWALKSILIPDRDLSWLPFAVRLGRRALDGQGVHAVVSTSPTVTNHLVAFRLARAFGARWIADFRDPWTEAPNYQPRGLRRRIDERIERSIICSADAVVFVSEWYARLYRNRYPEASHRIHVIRNGFDPDDFPKRPIAREGSYFHLVYAGSLHGGRQHMATLLRVLSDLKTDGLVDAGRFRISYYGFIGTDLRDYVSHLNIDDLVSIESYVPYRSIIPIICQADGLLLTPEIHVGPTHKWAKTTIGEVPLKTFDYIGAWRPILALAPSEYEIARFVTSLGIGWSIPPSDQVALRAWLLARVKEKQEHGGPPPIPEDARSRFTRQESTRQLSVLLDGE